MSQPARGRGAPSMCLLGLVLLTARPTLTADTPNWSCVRDNVTGLTWEVKTDDGGLRDQDNTYSWYNPDASSNGGDAGTQNGGTCTGGIACDTHSYVRAVNIQRLCGASDWRLPNRRELVSIVSIDRTNPPIDLAFFPNTPSDHGKGARLEYICGRHCEKINPEPGPLNPWATPCRCRNSNACSPGWRSRPSSKCCVVEGPDPPERSRSVSF